ncbi:hypothetical protein OUZ56_000399 [Daphnia magna]|uniref:Uncharacterized protein n=1 Tax=Daphnia magna TaxID=35525 RepID=A0A0P6BNS7_9CRUS|nr:hypothetical protein OUZ56_000399 [Daphnia magna]
MDIISAGIEQYFASISYLLKEFDEWFFCAAGVYIALLLVSIRLLYNQNSWFSWIEMIRCLTFLGYQLHFRTFSKESGGESLLMNSFRLLHLYSAVKCQLNCVDQLRKSMQKKKVK